MSPTARRSPQALERRAAALKGSGFDVGWTDGDLGHGKTFVCKDPDGHVIELYYDTEWYEPPAGAETGVEKPGAGFPRRAAATCAGSITGTAWPPTFPPAANSSRTISASA